MYKEKDMAMEVCTQTVMDTAGVTTNSTLRIMDTNNVKENSTTNIPTKATVGTVLLNL